MSDAYAAVYRWVTEHGYEVAGAHIARYRDGPDDAIDPSQYRTDLEHIWCACHNGHYDLNGRNIAGPPPRPLTEYDAHVQGDEIIISKKA